MVRDLRRALLAEALGADESAMVALVPAWPEDEAFPHIAELSGRPLGEVMAEYRRLHTEARRQRIGEIGYPTPHRLA